MTVRLTHIGGPTLLVEAHGWRVLSDPTFDPPEPAVFLRLGHALADPRTTEHYDRARGNLDRHGVRFLTAYVSGA